MDVLDFLAIIAGYTIGALLVTGASALWRRWSARCRRLATRTARR